jgi:exodeoxyribonuclease X
MTVGDPWSTYCNPNVPIAPGAKAVHHIEERDLLGHPHPDEVLANFEDGADYIIAHNLKFELNFVTPSVPTICTLKCARQLIPDAKQHTNQYLRYFLDLPVEREKATPAHAAGPDTYVTAHLLKHLLMISAKMGGDFVGRLVEISNSMMLVTIPFGKYRGMKFSEIARIDRKYMIWMRDNTTEAEVRATAEHWLNQR